MSEWRKGNHWIPPEDGLTDRDNLAGIIHRALAVHDFIESGEWREAADAVIAAGWVHVETFRMDTTNQLGMCMVHEDGDPDLGYDRGITDAIDVVNGTP